MSKNYVSIILTILGLTGLWSISAFAHQKHPATASPSPVVIAVPTQVASSEMPTMDMTNIPIPTPTQMAIPWKKALFEHMHNKVVHFPIALGLAGVLLLLLSYKWPEYYPAARLLFVLAAVSAIGAFFTGRAQEEHFKDSEWHDILEIHEKLGIATTISLIAGGILTQLKGIQKWLWIYMIVLAGLIVITGFLGGILATA